MSIHAALLPDGKRLHLQHGPIDLIIGDQPGAFRTALQIINDNGGDIISVGMTGQETSKRAYYFRLTSCKTNVIRKALEKEGFEVLNAMD